MSSFSYMRTRGEKISISDCLVYAYTMGVHFCVFPIIHFSDPGIGIEKSSIKQKSVGIVILLNSQVRYCILLKRELKAVFYGIDVF